MAFSLGVDIITNPIDIRANGPYQSSGIKEIFVSPDEFKAARLAAGLITLQATATALESDLRTIKRWEYGERTIPGPARVALRCLAKLRELTQTQP